MTDIGHSINLARKHLVDRLKTFLFRSSRTTSIDWTRLPSPAHEWPSEPQELVQKSVNNEAPFLSNIVFIFTFLWNKDFGSPSLRKLVFFLCSCYRSNCCFVKLSTRMLPNKSKKITYGRNCRYPLLKLPWRLNLKPSIKMKVTLFWSI